MGGGEAGGGRGGWGVERGRGEEGGGGKGRCTGGEGGGYPDNVSR